MNDKGDAESKKAHRNRHSGRKAEKKHAKKQSENQELTDKQRNPKAFAFNSAIRAERRFRRKQDIETKKQHVPEVDRAPIEPPPILIAVVGPPKVGKTTLINNLIKLFTRSPLTDIKGPVTLVTGKKRRITFIECNNDINSMIDLAKVADLALLLCDASFGFEMEVFEFLNICQVHGMPRIMGVLTHLDMIKNSKTLKNTKKALKHRFWTEVYAGAKLFNLSGILHGEYLRNEIKNLGRFISVMKFRQLTWRTTHSYLLVDRFEDLTSLEEVRRNPKCDRTLSLYGYVRGVPLVKNSGVHVAGFGDTKIADMTYLPDPCPLPEAVKKRALIEKEKLIYAPFSGVGGIVYDKDAVYVELGGSHSHNRREENTETSNIVDSLIDTKRTLDEKLKHSEMQLFTDSGKITAFDMDEAEENVEESQVSKKGKRKVVFDDDDLSKELKKLKGKNYREEIIEDSDRTRRKVIFDDDDDNLSGSDESDDEEGNDDDEDAVEAEEDDEIVCDEERESDDEMDKGREGESESSDDDSDADDMNAQWKVNLGAKATESYLNALQSKRNLMRTVYGIFDKANMKQNETDSNDNNEDEEADEIGGLFTMVSREQQTLREQKERLDNVETSLHNFWNSNSTDYLEEENKLRLVNCFVTGKWKESEDAAKLLELDDAELDDDDDEVFGDFEDLETGEKHTAAPQKDEKEKTDDKGAKTGSSLLEKKLKLKEKFNEEYDDTDKSYYDDLKTAADKQAQLNRSVFEGMPDEQRVQMEGYRPGMYVRLEIERVPSEFVTHFDATYPVIVGALNAGEENIGFVNVRLKRHRWHKKILKANDPVVISLGWRRFQTMPLYSKLEDDLKYRYLKYTPEHLACNAHFWGPITPQGTGFLALQPSNAIKEQQVIKYQGFRIVATGAVQELDKSAQIMKKLKLVGYPMKIYKKTAFIKGMFNSALEVAKFEGAKIKTVSGIRGIIKKAAIKPEGCFRATFEDKIQLSDIVFCQTWYKVDVQEFYNCATTLLLPPEQKDAWKGIRTVGEIKRDNNLKCEASKDSLYTAIEREPKVFKPMFIPPKLQKALPYRDKPKHGVKSTQKKKGTDRVAIIKEPHEKKVSELLKMIRTTYQHKQKQAQEKMKEGMEKHRRDVEAVENKKAKKVQLQKKNVFRAKSKREIRVEKKGR